VPAVRDGLRPGESMFAAAVRVVRGRTGVDEVDVWAVDLSGRSAVFAADVPGHVGFDLRAGVLRIVDGRARPPVTVAFRGLTRADFPDVVRWQTQPHVARWWQGEATSLEGAEQHYGPALDGADPTRMRVVELNGRSVGMLQDYRVGDHPEYALLTARPDAVGLDYLIGDPGWVGRGIGTRVLWCYLRDVLRLGYPGATEYFAAPDHRNAASLRVLDKLGFTRGLWFDEPQPDGGVDTVVGCVLDVPAVLG
jgi:aminoglycoside 6'-N-acetyltransferase